MSDEQAQKEQQQGMKKTVALKEDGYYSNCTMVEASPFDISLLFGKIRPVSEPGGQTSLVELYEKQIYLSHLQARALHEALGRSLANIARRQQGMGDTATQ